VQNCNDIESLRLNGFLFRMLQGDCHQAGEKSQRAHLRFVWKALFDWTKVAVLPEGVL
jgi:hypothetical protein